MSVMICPSDTICTQYAAPFLLFQTQGAVTSAAQSSLNNLKAGLSSLHLTSTSLGADMSAAAQQLFGAYKSQIQAAEGIVSTITSDRADLVRGHEKLESP